mgnify:CR=1 FL=1
MPAETLQERRAARKNSIDFKIEKKRILKKWEAEIEVDIKAQDWYIEAKRKLDFKLGYIKMLIVLDVVLLAAVYLIVGF